MAASNAQSNSANKAETIQLSSLPPAKLFQLRDQTQEEISELSIRIQQLNVVLNRFNGSREALEQFKPENRDATILAPISQSIYVDATICDVDNVLVDIGTGYHVEMKIEKAKAHFDNKIEMIKKSIEKISKSLNDKNKIFDAINSILMEQIKAQQQGIEAKKK
ncbi:prefoldin subunit 5 [Cryptosporidium sp. chipmunk genotype I]|uniref:prefoldin subunit 5 n=1 Tax=Cryptosporidium sp. chipmunk genotype I TaxID=1280935 RepID=UPI003519E698|nr:prefoldin subunit 5 [Cryptosporidium sp. chipmunk genotype I]